MKLRLTLHRGGSPVDVTVTADATATVGDVARALRQSDPAGDPNDLGSYTLDVADPAGGAASSRILDPSSTVAESALLSGAHVALARSAQPTAGAAPVARVRVLSGPDAGREFPIGTGASVIGRERGAEIRLSDPMVSKRHARINIGDVVEIVDLGSANGIRVSDDVVIRSAVSGSDVIALGDTTLAVAMLQQTAPAAGSPQIEHIRSPRVVAPHPGELITAPTPPKPPQRQRFPYIALVAPLIMGAVIFVLTQQLLGVVMMAMSPLLLIGAFFDQSLTARRQLKAERRVFDEAMTATRQRAVAAQSAERAARLAELPATGELAAHTDRLGPLLWTERPESATFLQLNAGIGTMPSRTTVELPSTQDTLPDCWERLLELRSDFTSIAEVPVPIVLADSGAVGYAGSRALVADVARAAVFQLAAKHSPAEVVVAAVVSPATRAEWEWLKWLPHSRSAHSPLRVSHLADHRTAASALLAQIDGLIDSRVEGPISVRAALDPSEPRSTDRKVPPIPAVVLVVEDSAPADRARLTRLAERGADAGVHVVWIAPRVEQLPAVCRSFVSVGADGAATVGQVRLGEMSTPVAVETLSAPVAERLARGLAPVIDAGVPESDDSDLPRSVPFPSLTGLEILDSPEAVVERWRQNDSIALRDGSPPVPRRHAGTLRALVGHAGSEPFALDLRTDGPHALVGGTTGAGKSEFLQAWVLGMAAAHSPDRLTFLFVDYKGGSAFADCVALPHTVGLVTDLSPHLVRRALTSLKAELRHREHLLNAKKAKDLITLEKTGDPDCPPSLIIVVDEFAALVKEVPEFVDGVVDVAQRGRSLGLHLVLATQRPAGVISENLRANTNLRIALRMADAEDSADILGDKMAAYFDPSVPGRGAAKRGPGRITSFQTGYAGGRTTGRIPPPRIEVNELDFGAEALWEAPRAPEDDVVDDGPTDIARIVATVKGAALNARVPEPRRPWLDELATIYNFEKLPNPHTDERLPIGVIDDPANQTQPVVHWEPDRDGNLAVYGTGGSGKSTALRTIAVAAAATRRHGGPTHVYGLDFGARGLSMLDGLAHVGAVVPGDDEERVVRTIRMLRDLVDERAVRYTAVRAATITEYRRLAGAPEEPRILLLVDGIGAFKEQYEFGPQHLSQWFTAFAQIAADGRGVGVHLVVAGDRPNALPASISSTVQRRIVLRMANEDEYLALGVPRDVVGPTSPPGRGILDGGEVQLALLGESSNVAVQAREMERLGKGLRRSGLVSPAEVQRLAEHVRLADLPAGRPGTAVIGLDDLSLQPAAISTRGAFLLAGPPSSGRTTALETLATGVQRSDMTVRRILLTTRRSTLTSAPWHAAAVGPDEVSRLIAALQPDFENGSAPPTALFIESLPEFTGTSVEYELDPFIKAVLRGEHFVVGEGETSTWGQAYTLAQPFKAGRAGLLLAPGDIDGDNLLGTSLGRIRRSELPPGRGFLIAKGRFSKLQIAQTDRSTK